MDDMDQENLEVDLKPQFFIDEYKQYSWRKLMDKKLSGQERFNLYEEATKKLTYAKHIPSLFRTIFENARLPYNDPRVLTLFLLAFLNNKVIFGFDTLADQFSREF